MGKGEKLRRVLAVREYRRALVRDGVPAALEHDRLVFPRTYASVLDVGANRGQFALFALRRFPGAALWCFEPYPAAFQMLERLVDGRARCVRCALAGASGAGELHVARADGASSLLMPTALQIGRSSEAVIAGHVEVEVRTLDEFAGEIASPYLLKVDVRGYELEVLRGGRALLASDGDLLIECSFRELYGGQPLAADVIAHLRPLGFQLRDIHSMSRGRDGEPLQADFFFSR